MATRNSFGGNTVFFGRARNPYYEGGLYGVELPALVADDLGAIVTAAASGVAGAATATGAGTITLNGALVSGGVATFDVGRSPTLTITATANHATSVNFTFNGTDDLGRTIKHTTAAPTGGTKTILLPFKTITSITNDAGWPTGEPYTIGSGNVFNFKFRVADAGKVHSVSVDGKPETTLTIVAALGATTVATATTGDPRGTWAPNTAPNSSRRFSTLYRTDRADDTLAFGISPYAG